MAFREGDPKPKGSGRKKGTRNKKKLASVEQFFIDRGQHPMELLLDYVSQIRDPADAAKIMLDVLQYWAPKVKPIEVVDDGSDEPAKDTPNPGDMSAEERLRLIRDASSSRSASQ